MWSHALHLGSYVSLVASVMAFISKTESWISDQERFTSSAHTFVTLHLATASEHTLRRHSRGSRPEQQLGPVYCCSIILHSSSAVWADSEFLLYQHGFLFMHPLARLTVNSYGEGAAAPDYQCLGCNRAGNMSRSFEGPCWCIAIKWAYSYDFFGPLNVLWVWTIHLLLERRKQDNLQHHIMVLWSKALWRLLATFSIQEFNTEITRPLASIHGHRSSYAYYSCSSSAGHSNWVYKFKKRSSHGDKTWMHINTLCIRM